MKTFINRLTSGQWICNECPSDMTFINNKTSYELSLQVWVSSVSKFCKRTGAVVNLEVEMVDKSDCQRIRRALQRVIKKELQRLKML